MAKSTKKLVLEIEPDYDFRLMGIVCSLPGYKLGWLFNQSLTFDLSRDEDIEVHLPRKKETASFEFYQFKDDEQRLEYYFLSNKSLGNYLVAEMKQVDYWLLIKGLFENLNEPRLLAKVKAIQQIQTAFYVDIESLKSKENLIF